MTEIKNAPLLIYPENDDIQQEYISLLEKNSIPYQFTIIDNRSAITIDEQYFQDVTKVFEQNKIITENVIEKSYPIDPQSMQQQHSEQDIQKGKKSSVGIMVLLLALVTLVVFGTDYIMKIIMQLFK